MILVEFPCERCTQALLRELRHLQNHEPTRGMRPELVAETHCMAGADRRAVDPHMACLARIVRLRSRLEQPGSTEPSVHTYGVTHDTGSLHERRAAVDRRVSEAQ